MEYTKTIAVDGPAGSGKSTIGMKLAEHLGYVFVDAGLLYRNITEQVLVNRISLQDLPAITEIATRLTVTIRTIDSRCEILINGVPASASLYQAAISEAVPIVAAYPEVRAEVRRIQRHIAGQGRVIFAGRDIGSVVLPDAELKIFLDASLSQRAARRYHDLLERNIEATFEQVLADLRIRDDMDTNRAESPLRPAEDAHILFTDDLSVEAVLEAILALAAH